MMCRLLEVSRSGFYDWCRRKPSATSLRREELREPVHKAFAAGREVYGSPRVHASLQREGVDISLYMVARLMREAKLMAKVRRKFTATTDSNHCSPIAPNLLGREFSVESPDSVWCSDITYVPTASGWVYLAVVLDLYTKLVVGWAMADHMRVELVDQALSNALSWRVPAEGAMHHSDRGVQYASDYYCASLVTNGFTSSMSRKGDCWDNAPIESFNGTYKQELVFGTSWKNLDEARAATYEYIEVFYNRQRLHSALEYRTPAEVDAEYAATVHKL